MERARLLPSLIRTNRARLPRRIRVDQIQAERRGTMPNSSDGEAIKITAEDLASVATPQSAVVSPGAQSRGAKVYGTINAAAEQFVAAPAERGSVLLQGWFYLGLAGLLGALAGWAIAEPGFADGPAAQSQAH